MIYILFLLLLNILPVNPMIAKEEPRLIINMENTESLPRNFRMTAIPTETSKISFTGLNNLKASASGQFSEKGLKKVLTVLPSKKILIVDLREECHGFVNGIAISWFADNNWANKGKTLLEIKANEQKLLIQLMSDKKIALDSKKSNIPQLSVKVEDVYTEEELVKSLDLDYFRIPSTDHLKPSNESIESFIQLMRSLKKDKNTWIHFHCAAGRGRSTTFIALYDMILNASNVSFEDIIARQALIGGKDLAERYSPTDWRYEHGAERLQFLANFYKYVQENPELEVSWSSWMASHNK